MPNFQNWHEQVKLDSRNKQLTERKLEQIGKSISKMAICEDIMQVPLLSLRIFRLLENIGSFQPRKAMQMSWVECTMCSWVLQYIGLKNMQVSLLPFKVSSTLIFLNQACSWASTLNFSIRCKSSSGDGCTSSVLMHNQQEIEIKKETKSPRTTNGATLRS